jgi:parallel beta-helix repeat protein
MGEHTGTRMNHRSAACKFPSELIRKKQLLRPRKIIMAVGLSFILATSLLYYLMLATAQSPIQPAPRTSLQITPQGGIAIDGDVSFLATAQLKGWPGDGSPGDPYIIDGLDIDLGGEFGNCIDIRNTQMSFIISNCNLTGAYFGICLENVTNGELFNNTCVHNFSGIYLIDSDYNTVVNNICTDNDDCGIMFYNSDSNIADNNICNYNEYAGIYNSWESWDNTVVNNTCSNNRIHGIHLLFSDFIITTDNTCFGNGHYGIRVEYSHNTTLVNNNCSSNAIVGIELGDSHYTIITNNTCNHNNLGMFIDDSNLCTIVNNDCFYNDVGIELSNSNYNVVAGNDCSNNIKCIYIYESSSNMVFNNTCNCYTEHDFHFDDPDTITEFDSVVPLLIGSAGIIVLGAGRKLVTRIRKFD